MLEIFTFVVALLLFVLPIVDWTAAYLLYRAYKQSNNNLAIKERGRMAGVLAIATTLNGVLATFRLLEVHPSSAFVLLILSVSLLLVSIPDMYWLYLYFGNRFRK